MSHTASKRDVRRFGVFEADLQSRELRRDGVLVKLQDQPFDLLAALLEKPGEVVTREALVARIWKDGTFVDFEAGLNTAAKRLRDALGDTAENPRFVQTLPKRGYRFIAPVEGGERRRDGKKRWPFRAGVAVAAVAALAFFIWRSAAPVKITSLAVLPMANLSQSAEEEYLADGMTEAVIASLAQVRSLDKVISRTSVMQFKGTKTPAPEIARRLGVKGIVEGTVQRHGERVRVTVQLIDAVRDRHIWSRSYDRDLRDVLMLQNEIARSIAEEVQAALAPNEKTRLAAAREVNPEAYQAFVRGREFCTSFTDDPSQRKGVELLERAVSLEPSFADAWAALGMCRHLLVCWGREPATPGFLRARDAAQRALEIDHSNADGAAVLALVLTDHAWDWSGAETASLRAVDLAPGSALAYYTRINLHFALGRAEEMIRDSRRMKELAPTTVLYTLPLGVAFLLAGRYQEAVKEFEEILELHPGQPLALAELCQTYTKWGRLKEAGRVYRELRAAYPPGKETTFDFWLAPYEVATGQSGLVRKTVEEWERKRADGFVSAFDIAEMHAALGDTEAAVRWLETTEKEKPHGSHFLKVGMGWMWSDELRAHPRYQAILRRMRFPE